MESRLSAKEGNQFIVYDINPDVHDCLKEISKNNTFFEGDILDFPRLTKIFKQHQGAIEGIIPTVGLIGEMVA